MCLFLTIWWLAILMAYRFTIGIFCRIPPIHIASTHYLLNHINGNWMRECWWTLQNPLPYSVSMLEILLLSLWEQGMLQETYLLHLPPMGQHQLQVSFRASCYIKLLAHGNLKKAMKFAELPDLRYWNKISQIKI